MLLLLAAKPVTLDSIPTEDRALLPMQLMLHNEGGLPEAAGGPGAPF